MISLTYLSTAVDAMHPDELEELLTRWRVNNADAGLTGMLLYAGGHFIQTLEGSAESVDSMYALIEADPRHREVFVTLRDEIERRVFPDWSMGFEYLDAKTATAVPGFNDYLDPDSDLYRGNEKLGRAGIFHRVFRDSMR